MEKVLTDKNDEKSCLQKIGRNKLLSLIALFVFVIVIITIVVLVIFYSHQKGKLTRGLQLCLVISLSFFLLKTIFCNWFEGF